MSKIMDEITLVGGQPSVATTPNVLLRDPQNKRMLVLGPTAPSGAKEYAVGCIFINTTTGVMYTNTGSTTSCTFTATGTVVGLTAVAAELNSLTGLPASVSMTTTPASGTCAVQLTFKDSTGTAITHAITGIGYSSAVDGLSVVAVTSFATLTNGAIDPITTTKDFRFITKADGTLGCTLTASAGTYYLSFQLPNGKIITTGAIVVNS